MSDHTVSRPVFRAAVGADVPAVVALVESAYRGESSKAGWTTEAGLLGGRRTDLQGVREAVDNPGGCLLLAEADGDLVACCQVERRGESAYFGMFAVRPTAQGGGLGKAVMAEAEEFARVQWGAERMEMTVIRQRAELIAWYVRRGYRDTGCITPFPYGDERFGIPRRPDLEFTALVKEL